MVAIPIAIPMIDKALRVLFLKGFFRIKLINLILSLPNNKKIIKLNNSLDN